MKWYEMVILWNEPREYGVWDLGLCPDNKAAAEVGRGFLEKFSPEERLNIKTVMVLELVGKLNPKNGDFDPNFS